MSDRFFVCQDESSHWYVVPVERKAEWEAWRDGDQDDPESWDAPEFAIPVNGHPNNVTFTDPRIE